jgi:hypothetical protein
VKRKILGVLIAAAAIVGLTTGQASAVTDGQLDGNGHPYVGLMVAQNAGGAPLWRCSGTLMSPTIFLTAGHCTESPAAHIEIWFAADVQSGIPGNGYPFNGDVGGTPFTHPQYDADAFFLHDLGVVVLDAPFPMATYGAVPALHALESMKPSSNTKFTAVGYGLQRSFPDAAAFLNQGLRIRMVAEPHLLQINTGFVGDFAILLSNNANTGGTCFGDSGGPNFIGSSNTLAGVTSFGLNRTCAGTGGVYRIDQADDQTWLDSFGL